MKALKHDKFGKLKQVVSRTQSTQPKLEKRILLNPGPVNTSEAVKNAFAENEICHRDSDFRDLIDRLSEKFRKVLGSGEHNTPLFVSGSGTAGLDMAVSSCAPHDSKILIVSNGSFGDRLAEIASAYEIDHMVLKFDLGRPVELKLLEKTLDENPEITQVYATHHETSTGILNPISEIGHICRKRDLFFIVDCVSSIGAEKFFFDKYGIDLCITSANKALHALSGISILCLSPRMRRFVLKNKARNYYLSMAKYIKHIEENSETPFTPAVNNLWALEKAADEILEMGLEKRWLKYKNLNRIILFSMMEMGFVPFTDPKCKSNSINIFYLPENWNYQEFYDRMKEEGFIIYGCKGHLHERAFLIANMGELGNVEIKAFLNTISKIKTEFDNEIGIIDTGLKNREIEYSSYFQ